MANRDYVGDLAALYDRLKLDVAQANAWPEPSLRLDLESRSHDRRRMFKHLDQTCFGHSMNLNLGSRVKLVYLIAFYVSMAKERNPFGIYSAARVLMEFNAFLASVDRRLRAASEGAEEAWRSRGEAFFGVVMRARFGTRDPRMLSILEKGGVAVSHRDPFNINACLEDLAARSGKDALSRYATLCDCVHHNVSSNTVATAGFAIADGAVLPGGSIVTTQEPGPVSMYVYPSPARADGAVALTGEDALHDSEECVVRLNEIPYSPYQIAEIEKMTGSRERFRKVPLIARQTPKGARRNEPCPCGSGRKYKNCCGGR